MPALGHITPSTFDALMAGVKDVVSPDKLTADDLKARLDELGIVYKKSAKKSELIELYAPHFTPSVVMDWSETSLGVVRNLVLDKLGYKHDRSFDNADMQRGRELEEVARLLYEFQTEHEVVKPSRMEYALDGVDEIFISGECDGVVDETDRLIEIKCPNRNRHFEYKLNGTHVNIYWWQIQGYMMIWDKPCCDLVSFNEQAPQVGSIELNEQAPQDERIHIKTVSRDNRSIELLKKRLVQAYELAMEEIKKYRGVGNGNS